MGENLANQYKILKLYYMQPDYEQQKGDTFMVTQMINLFVEHA